MAIFELGEVQLHFAELLWAQAPISSGELVKLCAKEFGWKKSTTYTVLRKLCEKGIFENVDGTVKTRISRDGYYAAKSADLVNERFHGSLPAFIAAFMSSQTLTPQEADEIRTMIDAYIKETEQ